MAVAGKVAQLLGGLSTAGRLAEQPVAQRQGLIGADDIFSGLAHRHRLRFLARKKAGYFTGR